MYLFRSIGIATAARLAGSITSTDIWRTGKCLLNLVFLYQFPNYDNVHQIQ